MEINLINNRILIIGKTNSGKSVLCKWLVNQQKQYFQKIIIFSSLEKVNEFYKELSNDIYDEYTEDIGNQIFNKLKEYKIKNKDKDKVYNTLIIIDDLGLDIHNSKSLKNIFTKGRHINISCIVLIQYIYMLPPVIRSNSDTILISQQNQQSLAILCDEYTYFIDKQEFKKMYYDTVQNYHFLVINCNCSKNSDINNIYSKIKASY